MESFFSSLKTERTGDKIYRTRDEARADVFDYMKDFRTRSASTRPSAIAAAVEFERKASNRQQLRRVFYLERGALGRWAIYLRRKPP